MCQTCGCFVVTVQLISTEWYLCCHEYLPSTLQRGTVCCRTLTKLSGDVSRDKKHADMHSSPSSALRNSVESKRKSSVDHTGHLQGIVEASSSQEATAGLSLNSNSQPKEASAPGTGNDNNHGNAGSRNASVREPTAPDQAAAGGTGQPEHATDGGPVPSGEGIRGNAAVLSLLETGRSAVSRAAGAVFGNGSEAHREAAEHENGQQRSSTDSRDDVQHREIEESGEHAVTSNGTAGAAKVDAASNVSEAGSETEADKAGGIGSKLKQLKNHLSLTPDRKAETGSQDDEEEGEKEKLHLPEDLKEKLKEKV